MNKVVGVSILFWLGLSLLVSQAAIGQDGPAGPNPSEPELLWHKATALFPIRVILPADFDSTSVYPAVIALHGSAGSSERFGRIGKAIADAGFIAILPEGPYSMPYFAADSARHSNWELSTWTEEYDLGPPLTDDPAIQFESTRITILEFLPSVIDRIGDEYRVGPLYMFGFSLGGVYALVGGFYNRDQFDGIVAFGAEFSEEWFTLEGRSLEDGNDLQIRLAVGRSDPLLPFSHVERARDAFEEAGYEVTLDAFDGGHEVPDDALIRAVNWLANLAGRR